MNIDAVAKRLTDVANRIKTAKGPLELFGLFLRDDSTNLWDIVISAPWLKADSRTSFEYVASQLRSVMTDKELSGLSRIVILDHGGAVLRSFLEEFGGHVGEADVHFTLEGDTIIRRAYIILANSVTSQSQKKNPKKPRRKMGQRSRQIPSSRTSPQGSPT
jgi:hypothetical protein